MTGERIDEILASTGEARVVVVGDVMLDRYLEGQVDRISPEAPVPVVSLDREWDALGGAGNVALNVQALGAACDLIGVIGPDSSGERIRETLDARGLGSRLVIDESRPTTVKTRVVAQNQQVVRVDRESEDAIDADIAGQVLGQLDDCLSGADFVVFQDYNKGVLTPQVIRQAMDLVEARGLDTLVDPKWANFFEFRGATVFKPNRKELEGAVGEPARPHDAVWMQEARERLEARHLLLTLGAEGMVLASEGGTLTHVKAAARSVYDVSGAGDTVSAVVATVLAAGGQPEEAVRIATFAAGVGVAKAGVAVVSPKEIRAASDGAALAGSES